MVKHISGGGSSYVDAVRKGVLHIEVKPSKDKCIYVISNMPSIASVSLKIESEDTIDAIDEFEKYLFSGSTGGEIVFSTDVNAKQFSENPVKNWLLKKFRTLKNRFTLSVFLDRLRRKENIKAWTVGRYFIGTYTGDDGKTYNENSIVVDIIDVDRKTLFRLAQEIREYLHQESVLVKDASNGQIYFVSAD